jgi:hypothetical protein
LPKGLQQQKPTYSKRWGGVKGVYIYIYILITVDHSRLLSTCWLAMHWR